MISVNGYCRGTVGSSAILQGQRCLGTRSNRGFSHFALGRVELGLKNRDRFGVAEAEDVRRRTLTLPLAIAEVPVHDNC
jgi:hypothetical protein